MKANSDDVMNNSEYLGPSHIEKVIELQRKLNTFDAYMHRYIRLSSSLSEAERRLVIGQSQTDYRAFVDSLPERDSD